MQGHNFLWSHGFRCVHFLFCFSYFFPLVLIQYARIVLGTPAGTKAREQLCLVRTRRRPALRKTVIHRE
jgi:hypothetical protein